MYDAQVYSHNFERNKIDNFDGKLERKLVRVITLLYSLLHTLVHTYNWYVACRVLSSLTDITPVFLFDYVCLLCNGVVVVVLHSKYSNVYFV